MPAETLKFASSVVRERVLEHEQRGCGFFLSQTGEFYLDTLEGQAFTSLRLCCMDLQGLEAKARSDCTYDVLRDLDRRSDDGLLAGCTWKRLFAFEPGTLRVEARVEGLGEGSGCLAFDRAGDHIVLGSNLRQSVRTVDCSGWVLTSTKRVGKATHVFRGKNPHELVLLHGPTGSLAWFDCDAQRVTHRITTPPFGDAVATETSIFLATGTPRPWGFVPARAADSFVTTAGEGPVPGYLPMAGSELVTEGWGVAVVDQEERGLRAQTLAPRLGPMPHGMLQVSASGGLLFLLSEGSARAADPLSLTPLWEWVLPPGSFPLAVLGEGERALASFGRWAWSRLVVVERVPFPGGLQSNPLGGRLLRP